jgi:hypothetical protein
MVPTLQAYANPAVTAMQRPVDMTVAVGPVVSVYALTRQDINATTLTRVSFDSVRYRSDSVESRPSRLTRFSPGKAGCYIVSTYIEFCDTSTSHGNVYLYKNGANYMQIAGGGGTGAAYNNSTGSSLVFVTSTDYLEIFVYSQNALNILARDFSVAFLRA